MDRFMIVRVAQRKMASLVAQNKISRVASTDRIASQIERLMQRVAMLERQADLNPPLGSGGPCVAISRAMRVHPDHLDRLLNRQRKEYNKLVTSLNNSPAIITEDGIKSISNEEIEYEAYKTYEESFRFGRAGVVPLEFNRHTQWRMDLRGISEDTVVKAIGSFFKDEDSVQLSLVKSLWTSKGYFGVSQESYNKITIEHGGLTILIILESNIHTNDSDLKRYLDKDIELKEEGSEETITIKKLPLLENFARGRERNRESVELRRRIVNEIIREHKWRLEGIFIKSIVPYGQSDEVNCDPLEILSDEQNKALHENNQKRLKEEEEAKAREEALARQIAQEAAEREAKRLQREYEKEQRRKRNQQSRAQDWEAEARKRQEEEAQWEEMAAQAQAEYEAKLKEENNG